MNSGDSGENSQIAQNKTNRKAIGCVAAIGVGIILTVIGGISSSDRGKVGVTSTEAATTDGGEVEDEALRKGEDLEKSRKVSAAWLSAAYDANEVATQRWLDQDDIQVTGKIEAIELDFMNRPVVRVTGRDEFSPLTIHLTKDQAELASALTRGASITVRCKKVRQVIGIPQLKDCAIVG